MYPFDPIAPNRHGKTRIYSGDITETAFREAATNLLVALMMSPTWRRKTIQIWSRDSTEEETMGFEGLSTSQIGLAEFAPKLVMWSAVVITHEISWVFLGWMAVTSEAKDRRLRNQPALEYEIGPPLAPTYVVDIDGVNRPRFADYLDSRENISSLGHRIVMLRGFEMSRSAFVVEQQPHVTPEQSQKAMADAISMLAGASGTMGRRLEPVQVAIPFRL